jgi:hypothetical protein
MMAKFKKIEVEIGTNGHIKYNGYVIAVLGSWNEYEDLDEDLDEDTLYNQIKKRNAKN